MKVNRWKDWAERTFWTFSNTFLGLLTAGAITAIDLSTLHKLEAAALAAAFTTLKVFVAQQAGGSGDAIPGGVTEPR